MKRITKQIIAVCLSALMICTLLIPAYAESTSAGKEEVVYVTLNADGTVSCISIVNIIYGGAVRDYGSYTSVRNMTTPDKLTLSGGIVSGNTAADKLYYEGTLEGTAMPWTVSIRYFLDGAEYTAAEIAGKSGALELKIKIEKNNACTGNFFDSFALTAAVTLDTKLCSNITAAGATYANVGSDKQLSYTVLPGKGADIDIKADVKDFAMDPITINAVRLNLDIDVDYSELTDKVTELTDAIAKLSDGANGLSDGTKELQGKTSGDLSDGARELCSGTSSLKGGISALGDGVNELSDAALTLKNGTVSLDSGIAQLQDGIAGIYKSLGTLNGKGAELTGASAQIMSALISIQDALAPVSVSSGDIALLTGSSSQIKDGIAGLSASAAMIADNLGFAQYKAAMKQNGLDIDTLKAGNTQAAAELTVWIGEINAQVAMINGVPGYEEQTAALSSQAAQLTKVVTLLNADNASISGTEAYLGTMSGYVTQLSAGISDLLLQYTEFDRAISALADELSSLGDSVETLKSAIDRLLVAYSALDTGIGEYTDGVSRIVSAYSQLIDGASAVADGAKELKDGAAGIYSGAVSVKNGISGLADGADKLDSGAASLAGGISELSSGTDELKSGADELKDGAAKLKEKTDGLDGEISDKINGMLDGLTAKNSETVSFASEKNTDVISVQFVIKTGAVKAESAALPAPAAKEELTFLQKFFRLFGLY